VKAGSAYTIDGSGYAPSQLLTVGITYSGSSGIFYKWIQADAYGRFALARNADAVARTGVVNVSDSLSGGLLNSCTFQVT
jgi:hypothetical protein